jgi:uncharacterized membrane protein
MSRGAGIGHVLAPWPFLIFGFIALAGGAAAWPALGGARSVMVAFDAGAFAFLTSCGPLFRHGPREMRQSAQRNDANRGFLLLIAAVVTGVIMVAVGTELAQKGRPQPMDVVLVVCTLFLAGSSALWSMHCITRMCSTPAVPKVRTVVAFASLGRRNQIIGTSHIFRLIWR